MFTVESANELKEHVSQILPEYKFTWIALNQSSDDIKQWHFIAEADTKEEEEIEEETMFFDEEVSMIIREKNDESPIFTELLTKKIVKKKAIIKKHFLVKNYKLITWSFTDKEVKRFSKISPEYLKSVLILHHEYSCDWEKIDFVEEKKDKIFVNETREESIV